MSESSTHNRTLNHIALHTPDINAAIDFYTSIFGFKKLKDTPRCTARSQNPDAPIFRVYDSRLQEVKVAFLTTGNGVGFELFEFVDPKMTERASLDTAYARGGIFHIAVTDNDPEGLCAKIVAAGGKKIGETVVPASAKGENECTIYVADPWGMTVEICSCSFEKLMANRGLIQ